MNDFLTFRRMLMPAIIQVIFWLGLILCIYTGIANMIHGRGILFGLEVLILGPIAVRLACELLILSFRINSTLTDIRSALTKSAATE